MIRVYIGCFGSGLGHAIRMPEIAGELTSRGASVGLSSSGEVAKARKLGAWASGFDAQGEMARTVEATAS